ncbi:MAG: hypothetical protein ACREQM_16090 [Candidatus Dormibacteraceae bacterium]
MTRTPMRALVAASLLKLIFVLWSYSSSDRAGQSAFFAVVVVVVVFLAVAALWYVLGLRRRRRRGKAGVRWVTLLTRAVP